MPIYPTPDLITLIETLKIGASPASQAKSISKAIFSYFLKDKGLSINITRDSFEKIVKPVSVYGFLQDFLKDNLTEFNKDIPDNTRKILTALEDSFDDKKQSFIPFTSPLTFYERIAFAFGDGATISTFSIFKSALDALKITSTFSEKDERKSLKLRRLVVDFLREVEKSAPEKFSTIEASLTEKMRTLYQEENSTKKRSFIGIPQSPKLKHPTFDKIQQILRSLQKELQNLPPPELPSNENTHSSPQIDPLPLQENQEITSTISPENTSDVLPIAQNDIPPSYDDFSFRKDFFRAVKQGDMEFVQRLPSNASSHRAFVLAYGKALKRGNKEMAELLRQKFAHLTRNIDELYFVHNFSTYIAAGPIEQTKSLFPSEDIALAKLLPELIANGRSAEPLKAFLTHYKFGQDAIDKWYENQSFRDAVRAALCFPTPEEEAKNEGILQYMSPSSANEVFVRLAGKWVKEGACDKVKLLLDRYRDTWTKEHFVEILSHVQEYSTAQLETAAFILQFIDYFREDIDLSKEHNLVGKTFLPSEKLMDLFLENISAKNRPVMTFDPHWSEAATRIKYEAENNTNYVDRTYKYAKIHINNTAYPAPKWGIDVHKAADFFRDLKTPKKNLHHDLVEYLMDITETPPTDEKSSIHNCIKYQNFLHYLAGNTLEANEHCPIAHPDSIAWLTFRKIASHMKAKQPFMRFDDIYQHAEKEFSFSLTEEAKKPLYSALLKARDLLTKDFSEFLQTVVQETRPLSEKHHLENRAALTRSGGIDA